MLDRESLVIDGVRILGATLWTDYDLQGDQITGQVACMKRMNDHRLIETEAAGPSRRFLPGHARALRGRATRRTGPSSRQSSGTRSLARP